MEVFDESNIIPVVHHEYTDLVEETVTTTNVNDDLEEQSDPIEEVHQIINSLCHELGLKCERRSGFRQFWNPCLYL